MRNRDSVHSLTTRLQSPAASCREGSDPRVLPNDPHHGWSRPWTGKKSLETLRHQAPLHARIAGGIDLPLRDRSLDLVIVSERGKRSGLEDSNLHAGLFYIDRFTLAIGTGGSQPHANCQYP